MPGTKLLDGRNGGQQKGIYMKLSHDILWRLRMFKHSLPVDTWEEFIRFCFPQLENPIDLDIQSYFNLVWEKFEKRKGVHAVEFNTKLKFLLVELEKFL